MTKTIIKIDLAEYGLQETKAKQIANLYLPMIKMLDELETEFNAVVKKKVTPAVSAEARTLRLKIKNVRVAADKARKEGKAESLRTGNAIQAVYNTLEFAVKSKEEKLLAIEEHLAEQERLRLDKVEAERKTALEPYDFINEYVNFREMTEEKWLQFLDGVKVSYEKAKAEAATAEAERIEKERVTALHGERRESLLDVWQFVDDKLSEQNLGEISDKAWSEIVKALNEKKTAYDAEQDRIAAETERLQKEVAAKAAETKRIAAELKAKEAAEAERIAAEIQAGKDAETKAKEDKRQAALAPDKEKLAELVQRIEAIEMPSLKAKKASEIMTNTVSLLKKVTAYIDEQSSKL